MPRSILFEGRTVEVPDDATDDEVAGILSAPAAAPAADPWAEFRTPAAAPAIAGPAKPSAALDVAKALPTGVAKGAIGLAGLPGDVQAMGGSLVDRIMLGAGHKVMDWTGFGPQAGTPERERFDRLYLGIGSGGGLPGSGAIRQGVEAATGPLYEPQTTAGRYAQTIGEFAPAAAIGPGGLVRKVMETTVPAVASEAAGQYAAGTKAEPAARLVGAVMGNLGVAAGAARQNGAERAIVAATRGQTPDQLRAGQPVLDQGRGIGVPLSGPEGVQAATNGATNLGSLQRVVEGSVGGGPTMAAFYANRPAQMRAAAETAFDAIAPASTNPSTLGPRVAEAAESAIDGVRQGINRATRPDYAAAERHIVDPADFAPMQTPAFNASLQRLRADPVLGPEIAHLPDSSGRVIDLVSRDMGARSQALATRGEGFNPLLAERYGSGAAETRDILRDPARGGVQAYDDALTAQAQVRAQNLDPLTQGPLGAIARTGQSGAGTLNGTQAAADRILPAVPLTGGQGELADATRRIGAIDPEGIAQLVRQRLADQYEHSAAGLVGGPAQAGGAKFAKDIASDRSSQKQANLDAVLGALPNSPAAPAAVNTLLDTLRATGMRRPPGSNTATDRGIADVLSEQGVGGQTLTALRTQGRSLLTDAGARARQAVLGKQTGRLADLFVHPNSADLMADIVARGVEPVYANAMVRSALQGQAGQR